MTCVVGFRRHYKTCREAWDYLISRGFICSPEAGWENGRWAALVQPTERGVAVTVWLRLQQAA